MKPNYKNWIPKGMILGALGGAAASLVLFLVFGLSGLLAVGTARAEERRHLRHPRRLLAHDVRRYACLCATIERNGL